MKLNTFNLTLHSFLLVREAFYLNDDAFLLNEEGRLVTHEEKSVAFHTFWVGDEVSKGNVEGRLVELPI